MLSYSFSIEFRKVVAHTSINVFDAIQQGLILGDGPGFELDRGNSHDGIACSGSTHDELLE